jgi:hypothetical protein
MTEERPPQYRVVCPCGYTAEVRKQLTADAFHADHDETCMRSPEVQEC